MLTAQATDPCVGAHSAAADAVQVAKLLITPCTCLMEMLAVGKTITPGIATSIAMVVAGVAVV
jgi:hypothetical protein